MRIRPERVANAMRKEVAEILENELRDPRVSGMVSVTDVEVNQDLTMARIYVSVLHDEQRDQVMQALTHAVPFIRRQLAPRLGLREMPEIRFLPDTSIERGARVEELLRKLHDGEPIPDEDDGA
jgi:ribosome-binding factor A